MFQEQQATSQTPLNTTPGRSHGQGPQFHQPGLIEPAPPHTRFEFEVAEFDEADLEMAGNR
jgi:hypothetical protein